MKRKALTNALQKYILVVVSALDNYAAECECNDVYDHNEFDVDVSDENLRPAVDDNDGDAVGVGDDDVVVIVMMMTMLQQVGIGSQSIIDQWVILPSCYTS